MMFNKKNIFQFKILKSTMETAEKFAMVGCPNGTIIVAKEQTSGHGRMDRLWSSYSGGLYFSIIIRPNITTDFIAHITFSIAIDLIKTIKNLFKIKLRLKWPNDLIFNTQKISGILSYVKIEKNKIIYVNIGVGLNVNNYSNELNAISIADIIERKTDPNKILFSFLNRYKFENINLKNKKIIKEWKDFNITIGKTVKVVTLKKNFKGVAYDINSKGGLLILSPIGSIKTVQYGDCFHK